MIKVIFKYILYLIFFLYAVVAFLPKENLFYLLEKELFKQKVVISEERVKDNLFSFELKDFKVFYEDIYFSNVKHMEINTLLFSNAIRVDDVMISENFKDFVPQKIDIIHIRYDVINPKFVTIESHGEFGRLSGFVDILNQSILIELKPSGQMLKKSRSILNQMRKEKGVYKYEYKF